MNSMILKILQISEAEKMVGVGKEINLTPIVIILLGGDRIACCDEAVTMRTETGDLVGMATISSRGEDYSGCPEIVGLYILPKYRGKDMQKCCLKKQLKDVLKEDLKKSASMFFLKK